MAMKLVIHPMKAQMTTEKQIFSSMRQSLLDFEVREFCKEIYSSSAGLIDGSMEWARLPHTAFSWTANAVRP